MLKHIDRIVPALYWALAIACLCMSLWITGSTLWRPLLDFYSFRQTQTAISAYWIAQGGPWLAYWTPVVGAPWSIPFEFPLVQLLAAGLSRFGLPLDASGRIVSYAFYLATIPVTALIGRRLKASAVSAAAFTAFFLASPLYLFYASTFLIESGAVFFALAWVLALLVYRDTRSLLALAAAFAFGTFAVLVKSTTFASIVPAAAAALLVRHIQEGRGWGMLVRDSLVPGVVGVGLPLSIGLAWVRFTDLVKEQNALGVGLTSKALSDWNFGAWSDRFDPQFWSSIVLERVGKDLLGPATILAVVAVAAMLLRRRAFAIAFGLVVLALVPLMLFLNLHRQHHYYQFANGFLLLAAIAYAIGEIDRHGSRVIAFVLTGLLIASQVHQVRRAYLPTMKVDTRQGEIYRIAQDIKAHSSPSDVVLVFGIDWSSNIHFYAERKGIAVPAWTPTPALQALLDNPQTFLAGQQPTLTAHCSYIAYGDRQPRVDRFLADQRVVAERGACRLLATK